MAAGGAKYGLEPALTYYCEHGTPFYCLYNGKPTARHGNVIMHNWKGRLEDVEACAQHIRDRFMDTGVDHKTRYTLAWWDAKPRMTKGTPDEPAEGSVTFVCASYEQTSDYITGAQSYRERVGYINNEMVSRLSAIEAKLNQDDDEEEPEPEPQQTALIGALQNPAVMQAVQVMLMRLVDRVIPGNSSPVPIGAIKLAGVDLDADLDLDMDKMNAALAVLKQADPELEDDLIRLAHMAQTDPDQFKFLLKMLRK